MSVIVIAVATDSGVPIFSRKRGNYDNIQFSTIASLHGINMFSKCHNLTLMKTLFDNGSILWKEYCKSITLIGIVTGLECNLELLLSYVYNVMVFCIGKKELETLKNTDQLKRELRQCYPIIDCLLETVDPNSVSQTCMFLDLIQCLLCPQAHQLQQVLDSYSERVTGRWACLSIHGYLVATSSDFYELSSVEAKLLMMMLAASQDGVPLRETPIYLPQMSPNVAFRAVTCKLLADVYVLVICGATPPLAEIDEIVLQCWENSAHIIKEAKILYPRNIPHSITFEPCILGFLIVKISKKRCVFSRHLQGNQKSKSMSGPQRIDILRTLFVATARDLLPELQINYEHDKESNDFECVPSETYWCSEYHKWHGRRIADLMACVLYAPTVPLHTIRLLTNQVLQEISNSKEVFW